MKKIIGILGVTVIAVAMFFSANAISGSSSDTSFASLITMNSANAENNESSFIFGTAALVKCKYYAGLDSNNLTWNPECNCQLPTPIWKDGTKIGCPGWERTGCSSTDCK